jgi:tetratricopeptide (TPR) repeat protein
MKHTSAWVAVASVIALAAGCAPDPPPAAALTEKTREQPEARSPSGQPLFAPPITEEARTRMTAELDDARKAWAESQGDVDSTIWLGRRTAYLGRYRDAIRIYTEGLERYPDDPRLLRHRGHRYITVREFDLAIADLERAARLIERRPPEVEPDGQPNARNIPTSTLQSNVWYHLALARYLTGDFARAAAAWQQARDAVDNPDNLVAASNWLYLASRRAGRPAAELAAILAPIRADLDVIENTSYHALLLMYKGERSPEDVLNGAGSGSGGSAVRYGVGAWHFVNGRNEEARRIWDEILKGTDWPSFGFIAAERER